MWLGTIRATTSRWNLTVVTTGCPANGCGSGYTTVMRNVSLVFGTLDNEPVVNTEDLQLGEELAINYGKVREHRKPWEFHTN